MKDPYQAFLESPTRTRYRSLRQVVLSDPAYEDQSTGAAELEGLWRRRAYRAFARRERELFRTWKLSPRYHWLVGTVAIEREDQDTVELAKFQFQTCLAAMLHSGSGTVKRPYLVTRSTDAYDILDALQRSAGRQQLIDGGGVMLDVIQCIDGGELCFDAGVGTRTQQAVVSHP